MSRLFPKLRNWVSIVRRTPIHPQWLLGKQSVPAGVDEFSGRVLDVGAGDQWIKPFFREGARYVSLDYLVTGRSIYSSRPDVFADAAQLPFPDGSFDAVVCLEVIEHVREPERVIAEIARVLVNEGTLWLSMPFLYPIHDAPHDFQRYTLHGLERSLRAGGFRIQEVSRSLHAMRTVGLLTCLAAVGAVERAPRWQWPLLFPLAACLVPLTNIVFFLASFLWPDWEGLTVGYSIRAVKN